MELVNSLDYINVIKEVKDERKSQFINDLSDAFNDVLLLSNKINKILAH